MLFSILENQRQQLKSFKTLDHLNKSIRAYMYKFKKHFYNQNFKDELNAVGKVFKFIYTHSINPLHIGISYWSNKKIAKELELSIRSVKRATKKLVELGIILKVATKRSNGSDTSNTLVIKPLLSSVVERLFNGVNTPCHPTLAPLESESFNHLKQESNNNIDMQSQSKIVEYIKNRVNDSIKKGTKIKYLSSYVDRIVRALEQQALYDEQLRQLKAKQEREQQQSQQLRETLNGKVKIPFYNWLED